MPIPMKCPGCQASFNVPDQLVGKTIRCTSCKTQLAVTAAGAEGQEQPPVADEPAPSAAAKKPAAVKATPAAAKATPARPAAGKPVRAASKWDDDDDDEDEDDDRPARRGRKSSGGSSTGMVALIGGGVLGLCAVVGLGAWLMLGTGGDKKKTEPAETADATKPPAAATPVTGAKAGSKSEPKPAPAGTAPAADKWQTFTPPDGWFTADFPGQPTTVPMPSGNGSRYEYKTVSPKELFVVVVIKGLEKADNLALAPLLVEFGALDLKAKEKRTVTVDGQSLEEVQGTDPSGRTGALSRGLRVGGYELFALVVSSDKPSADARMKRFIESFKVTYTPPAGSPEPGPVATAPRPMTPPAVAPNPTAPMPPGSDPTPPGPMTPPAGPGGFGGPPGGAATAGGDARPPLFAKLDTFHAIAFDPEKGDLFTLSHRTGGTTRGRVGGTLTRYSYPDFKRQAEYKLPAFGTRAVIDPAKGVLYFASAGSTANPTAAQVALHQPFDRVQVLGDIHAVDLEPIRGGKVDDRADVKTTVIPVGAVIAGLELAPDGSALYVLVNKGLGVRQTASLRQYDPAERKMVRAKDLPERAWDMRAAADGKTLLVMEWPRNPTQAVSVVAFDPAAWAHQSHKLPGPTTDIAPTPDGRFVAGVLGGTGSAAKLHLLDAAAGDKGEVAATGARVSDNNYVAFTPDAKHLLATSFGSNAAPAAGSGGATGLAHPGLDVYEVTDPAAAGGYRKVASVRQSGGPTPVAVGGFFHVAPKGDHVVFQTGAVLEVAKLTETVSGPDITPASQPGAGNQPMPGQPGAAPGMPPPGTPPGAGQPGNPGVNPGGRPPGNRPPGNGKGGRPVAAPGR